MKRLRRHLLGLLAALSILVCLPAVSLANAGDTPNVGTATPIFSEDLPFQLDILAPASGQNEALSFACVLPTAKERTPASRRAVALGVAGQTISQDDVGGLRRMVRFLQDFWDEEDFTDTEKRAMARYLADGTPFSSSDPIRAQVIEKSIEKIKPVSGSASPQIRAMMNPTPQERDDITAFIPKGCPWNLSSEIKAPPLSQFLSDPGDFLRDTFFYLVSQPGSIIYDNVAPFAYRYTFFTPHSERGESIFTAPGFEADRATVSSASDPNAAARGYDIKLINDPEAQLERGSWLKAAVWLRAFVSGFYILIILVAAFLFMIRGSVRNKLNVLELAPMVLLSIIIVMLAPVLIGYGITASNLLVGELFRMDSSCAATPGLPNSQCVTALQQVNGIIISDPGGEGAEAGFYRVLSLNSAALAFSLFAAYSVVRQIALIALVVLTPLACFALLFPRQRALFFSWVAGLVAVIGLPVGMALVLKIGLALNPLVGRLTDDPTLADVPMGVRMIGLLVLLVTFWFMLKVPRMVRSKIMQSPAGAGFRDMRRSMSQSAVRSRAMGAAGLGMAGVVGGLAGRAAGAVIPRDDGNGDGPAGPGPGLGSSRRTMPGVGGGAGQFADSARAMGLMSAAAPGAGAAGAAGPAVAGGAAAGPLGAAVTAAVVGGAAAGSEGPSLTGGVNRGQRAPMRTPITRREYDSAMAEHRQQLADSLESGIDAPPRQMLPVADGEEHFFEQNLNYPEELAQWEQANPGVSAGAGARAVGAVAAPVSAAAAASYASDADALDTVAPVMGRSAGSLDLPEDVPGGGASTVVAAAAGAGIGAAAVHYSNSSDASVVEDMGPAVGRGSSVIGSSDPADFGEAAVYTGPSLEGRAAPMEAQPDIESFFAETPEPSAAAPMDAGSEQMVDAMREAGAQASQQISDAAGELGERLAEGQDRLSETMAAGSARIAESARGAGEAIAGGHAAAASQLGDMVTDQHREMGETFASAADQMRSGLDQLGSGYASLISDMGERHSSLAASAGQISTWLQGTDPEMLSVANTADAVRSGFSDFGDQMRALEERFRYLRSEDLPVILSEMSSQRGHLDQMSQMIAHGLSQNATSIASVVPGVAGRIDEELKGMAAMVKDSYRELDELHRTLNSLTG